MLTDAEVAQYEDDGYVMVEGALLPETLAELHTVTAEVVASAAGIAEHTPVLDLEASHTPEEPRVRRIKQPHLAHPFYRDLAADPRIMAALEPLIGADIRLRAGGKINMKAAEYGSPVEWHQDWAFYPHTNQDVLAVGILLDDMDADNGPLLVLPGSHKGPVYNHHSHGAFCGAIDVDKCGLDVSNPRELHGRAGDISIHHVRLVHGSALNTSNRERRVLFYEYAAADAWPLAGIENLSDLDDFNSRMVHGQPTTQPRLEDVPVRMPLPRAPYQGSIYENQRTLSGRYFEREQAAAEDKPELPAERAA